MTADHALVVPRVRRVLVAGATGALGRNVVRILVGRGHHVRVLSRSRERAARLCSSAHEVHVGDALAPARLNGAMQGVDAVVSMVGASTRPVLGAGWRGFGGVDVPANLNLLAAARAAGVRRFCYLAAFRHPALLRLAYYRAHERVAAAIVESGLEPRIVRATGFFSVFDFFLDAAREGPIPCIGDGSARSNPIHEADLAEIVAEALAGDETEVDAGGPEVLSRAEIAHLAAEAVGKKARLRAVPAGAIRAAALLLRPWHPRLSQLFAFAAGVSTHDVIAPARGARHLRDYFRERVAI